jgi:hypothetical protein
MGVSPPRLGKKAEGREMDWRYYAVNRFRKSIGVAGHFISGEADS